MSKTAIVIGATGLVGKELIQLLLKDESFSKVKVLHRRTTGISHEKLEEHVIDFEKIDSYKNLLQGDILFSSLGTTIKQAGSQEAQYKIDFTYQYEPAKAASENGVKHYVLVSSSGASAKSKVFYSRIKGELEDAVNKLSFEQIDIMRPSLLLGNRPEKRFGEQVGAVVLSVIKHIPVIKKYRGIKGSEVAQAMINASQQKSNSKTRVHELEGVFELLDFDSAQSDKK